MVISYWKSVLVEMTNLEGALSDSQAAARRSVLMQCYDRMDGEAQLAALEFVNMLANKYPLKRKRISVAQPQPADVVRPAVDDPPGMPISSYKRELLSRVFVPTYGTGKSSAALMALSQAVLKGG